jgi:mevalonate kinase
VITNSKTFYAHGKLLLTGEYFVLDGAKALAIPTQYGQRMEITDEGEPGKLTWISYDHLGKEWLNAVFTLPALDLESEAHEQTLRLQQVLLAAGVLNPAFISTEQAVTVKTYLEFPIDWGFGSSSTIVYNVAQWAGVDAFELLDSTFGGSGYDVACASADGPIVYCGAGKVREVTPVDFNPPFKDNLFFVYLESKQDSREGINRYRSFEKDEFAIYGINMITEVMPTFSRLDQFSQFMERHEQIVADFIKIEKVKNQYFDDFPGSIKSLGAWGGDFILAAADMTLEQARDYFEEKGFPTVLPWAEVVLGG